MEHMKNKQKWDFDILLLKEDLDIRKKWPKGQASALPPGAPEPSPE
jgi:hypothetical protein